MFFDVFFSLNQTTVESIQPFEWQLLQSFFEQVEAADKLGYGVAWVAQHHFMWDLLKRTSKTTFPNYKGNIGLNSDILLLAPHIFSRTKNIEVGEVSRNLISDGGPIAHAQAVRTFMAFHAFGPFAHRRLHLGLSNGEYQFNSSPFWVSPRSDIEKAAWPALKKKIFAEALEVFLNLVSGYAWLSSSDVAAAELRGADFQSDEEWDRVRMLAGEVHAEKISIPHQWSFERQAVIPQEVSLNSLRLYAGSHDASLQQMANRFMPCGVMDASLTSGEEIERTHKHMAEAYYFPKAPWQRSMLPRLTLVFLDTTSGLSAEEQSERARKKARRSLEMFWLAHAESLDLAAIETALKNALVGNASEVVGQLKSRYHQDDRLMLWFDFCNHNSKEVVANMAEFQRVVVPEINK
jgi:alkanesulfonate monooxygenase SsuD/methylene tetrahydromethanopterin reductase-like flavin-dependent oxidoreductase (luciferase family)